MIRIIAFWIIQAVLLAGLGILLQQLLWKRRPLGIWDSIWVGMAALITLVQFWHFFFPVNAVCLLLLAALAAAGLPALWRSRPTLPQRELWFYLGLLLVLALVISSHVAVRSIAEGDSRLYHLNMVRWINEFPVVPGLANLHQRFGVNSSWLLYAAVWDAGWMDGRSAWLISGLPLLLTLGQWLAVFLFRRGRAHRHEQVYCLLTFPFLLEGMEWSGPSLYYDKPPLLVLLVLGLHLLRAGWLRKTTGTEWVPSAMTLLSLAALAFSMKASSALALAMIFFLAAAHWWKSSQRKWSDAVLAMALPSLLVAGWMGTNVLTSGYPLFPAAIGGIPADWAQPKADVVSFYQLIADWARLPGSDGIKTVREGFWEWWPKWVHNFAKTPEHYLAWLAGMASLVTLWAWWTRRVEQLPWRSGVIPWMLAFGTTNVLFWLCSAPDLRFGDGLFYLWLGLAGALALPLVARSHALVLSLIICLGTLAWVKPTILPGKEFWLTKVWQARTDPTREASAPGTPTILVPTDASMMLGDCPLPSAPTLDKRLRWREPGNLAKGFRLELPPTD